MDYRENKAVSEVYKEAYVAGLNAVVAKRQQEARENRHEYVKDIFKNPDRYRDDLKRMLGWPLVGHKTAGLPKAKCEKISDEDGYSVYRMQFEVLEGLNMSGLFFKADGDEKRPLVIVQHGGDGTPELISGAYGDTANYNEMLHRVRRHGVHVFAPQLLLWSKEYGAEYDRKAIDAQLKAVGSSVTAVEIYGISRILDYFESQEYVSEFGMVGLSYGGFYTLYTAAVDTRIKSAISCSFFNSRDAIPWSDWLWRESADKFNDAEIACLIYPRKLWIEIGEKDDLFDCKYGKDSFEKLKEMCGNVGCEWVEFIVFDGVHEFCMSDEPIESFVSELKTGRCED